MKRILSILICCIAAQWGHAQAPKWADKARKAVFSIVTYDKDNQIKGTGNGFYIDESGTALSDYTLFEGAERAVVVNAEGKELSVSRIMGANSMYDVVKFRARSAGKIPALPVAALPATVGETVWLLPYSTQKAATCPAGKVTRVDTIGDKAYYYTLAMTTSEKTVSCPVMNANGEVLGLIQKSASNDATESYAIGVGYGASLSITPLSLSDMALGRIGIRKDLPDTEDQAVVYLYMASTQQTPEAYRATLDDFIDRYPDNADGYVRRAAASMEQGDNASADADMKKALQVTTNRSETLYNIAKLLYSYALSLEGKEPYGDWDFGKALSCVREALQAGRPPVYVQLEGDILFAMGQYPEAYAAYEEVNRTELASPATFYSAAKAKQLTEGADLNEVVALMDSAIVRFTRPYLSESAPYFYERAEVKVQMNKFREAVMDYDLFYEAIGGHVTAAFHLRRGQAEVQCRMYQQAIDDMDKAVELAPEDPEMWMEKGAVRLRVAQYAEAVAALEKAVSLNPQAAAAYRMLGYCQVMLKKPQEACASLAKAKELGDEVADGLIRKYCQ